MLALLPSVVRTRRMGRAAVLFEVGIAVPTNIGRLMIGRLGLVNFATLVTTKGAFANTAAGQRKTARVIARLGWALIFAREAAAVQQLCPTDIGRHIGQSFGRVECVVRLGLW